MMSSRRVWPIVAIGLVAASCSDEPSKGWDFERMRVQPRYSAYGASAFFPDGKAMRTPPRGTVPRNVIDTAAMRSEAMLGSAAMIRRGADRFHIFCAACHGEQADGQSVVASNMTPPPPTLRSDRVRTRTPDELYAIVANGFARMPPYASELATRDRWAVVAYVRSLSATVPGEASDSVSGSSR